MTTDNINPDEEPRPPAEPPTEDNLFEWLRRIRDYLRNRVEPTLKNHEERLNDLEP